MACHHRRLGANPMGFRILEMAVASNRTELHNIIAGVGDTAGRILVGIKGGIQF